MDDTSNRHDNTKNPTVETLPVAGAYAPSTDRNRVEPKRFFVTLEMIKHPGNDWVKHWNVNEKVIVITNLTEDDTIESFRMKVREEDPCCTPDKMWRVFFPHNLPDYFIWRFSWKKRKDYLVDMTQGDKTLKDIGIGPDNNCLVYFIQTQFESRDEP